MCPQAHQPRVAPAGAGLPNARAGLIENEAYKELVDIVSKTLLSTAGHIDNAREMEEERLKLIDWAKKAPIKEIQQVLDQIADRAGSAVETSIGRSLPPETLQAGLTRPL